MADYVFMFDHNFTSVVSIDTLKLKRTELFRDLFLDFSHLWCNSHFWTAAYFTLEFIVTAVAESEGSRFTLNWSHQNTLSEFSYKVVQIFTLSSRQVLQGK